MNLDPIISSTRGGLISQGNAASACEAGQRFDVIVLSADEFQPHKSLICALAAAPQIIYAPLDDAQLTESEIRIATAAAENVANAYAEGKKILVTCFQGRNRSGLITALAMHLYYGMSGQEAVSIVKKQRKDVLTNPSFVDFLSTLPAKP